MADTLIGLSFDALLQAPQSAPAAAPDEETTLVTGLREGDAQAYEDLILRYQ